MLTSKVAPTSDGSQSPRQHSRLAEIWPLPFRSSFLHSSLWILCSLCQEHLCFFPRFRPSSAISYSILICMGFASAQLAAWIIPLAQHSGSQPPKYLLSVALVWQVHCLVFHSSCVSPPLPQAPRLENGHLDFFPVVGIGHRAFSENVGTTNEQ